MTMTMTATLPAPATGVCDDAGVPTTGGTMADPTHAPADVPTLEMVRPMVGFPEHREFALVRLDDEGVLTSLTSVEDESLQFLVVPPVQFFPDYAAEIDDEVAGELGITDPADGLVLTVLTAGRSLAETTANLLAPIVVNIRTRRAAQVLLESSDWPVAAPLLG